MKIITFDGRLGKDATVKVGKSGKKFLSFTVANNSFYEGQQRVDWFDVACFDPYLVGRFTDENGNVRLLKKGTYVIITGTVNSAVNTGSNGNMYINHNVNATFIDRPNVGPSSDYQKTEANTEDVPQVSVYTANTQTQKVEQPVPQAQPSYAPAYSSPVDVENGDDLPF